MCFMLWFNLSLKFTTRILILMRSSVINKTNITSERPIDVPWTSSYIGVTCWNLSLRDHDPVARIAFWSWIYCYCIRCSEISFEAGHEGSLFPCHVLAMSLTFREELKLRHARKSISFASSIANPSKSIREIAKDCDLWIIPMSLSMSMAIVISSWSVVPIHAQIRSLGRSFSLTRIVLCGFVACGDFLRFIPYGWSANLRTQTSLATLAMRSIKKTLGWWHRRKKNIPSERVASRRLALMLISSVWEM